ncbi:MAG TPA: hypothetical protein VEU29_02120 [Actinomycetota bacterium]|nr:hypothetical protein [Actinomycetota bacterium]
MRTRRAILWSCMAALCIPAAIQAPAWADDSAPSISSFRRISPDLGVPLQPVVVEFEATDEGGAGLEYALFTYRSPIGAIFRVDSPYLGRSPGGTFEAVEVVGPWAAAGQYTLELVEVYDRERNLTTYERDASPGLDFAAADFRIDNPNEDVTAPVVTFAKVFDESLRPGEPAVVLYTASDDRSGVAKVAVSAWVPTLRDSFNLQPLPGLDPVGPASWIVPLGSPTGEYEIFGISVEDRAGNGLSVMANEPVRVYPEGAAMPSKTPADPNGMGFTVDAPTQDVMPPRITRLERVTPHVRRPGDQIATEFATADEGTGVSELYLSWSDGMGHELEAWKRCGDRSAGTMTVTLEDFRSVDRDWTLTLAVIRDRVGNSTGYHRNGAVTHGYRGQSGTHDLDFSRLDFRVEAGEPSAPEFPDTSSEVCRVIGDVSLGTDDATVLAGQEVPLSGSVTGGSHAVARPVIAIHGYRGDDPVLLDVVEGTAQGGYRTAFEPRANTRVVASYLGSEGPRGAEASSSRSVAIRVAPRVVAAFEDGTVSPGDTARLSGSVWPPHPGDEVLLQRKGGRGWRTMRQATLSPESSFDFRWAATRTSRYRVVKPADDDHVRGSSPARRLTVSDR